MYTVIHGVCLEVVWVRETGWEQKLLLHSIPYGKCGVEISKLASFHRICIRSPILYVYTFM